MTHENTKKNLTRKRRTDIDFIDTKTMDSIQNKINPNCKLNILQIEVNVRFYEKTIG